ncbi:MAG: hypothetical protein UY92_C0002G0005 [Candidatus Magasanikbacteria bacterium GW2011_GWA2_56_11]|uniref:Glycerophosphoryl diester phosphodiesterase membrane domain-containing protein n=1 Tax=Candidatus Magasanikbacteria bacterium GW2011_GWA2_56_11 TaxID=1619044 RepID=A0A0G1YHH1_9BACT|nr:MAG: hypothetical protein UY92_C0002G0005 [Candidatus Magasanikbacteria bacterium GW2011_GWA2_56_11]
MREPTYAEALRASWRLAWKHKDLWVFGLFAMMLGQFGIVDLLVRVGITVRTGGLTGWWEWCRLMFSPRAWQLVGQSLNLAVDGWVWFVWLAVLLTGLALAAVYVAVVSQGALVYAAAKYAGRLSVFPDDRTSWHRGVSHFWRLLSLNVLRKVLFGLVALTVMAAGLSLAAEPSAWDRISFLLVFILAVLAGLIFSFLLVYAAGYVVVEERSFGEAVVASWRLFVRHWLVSIEVGLMVLAANVVFLLIALAGVVYVFFLPVLAAKWLAAWSGSYLLFQAGVFFGYVLFIVFMLFIGSVFTVFTTSVWTYLFTKMHQTGLASRLTHWLRR